MFEYLDECLLQMSGYEITCLVISVVSFFLLIAYALSLPYVFPLVLGAIIGYILGMVALGFYMIFRIIFKRF